MLFARSATRALANERKAHLISGELKMPFVGRSCNQIAANSSSE